MTENQTLPLYVIITGLLFLFLGAIWTHKDWFNIVLKVVFFLFADWALLILGGRL